MAKKRTGNLFYNFISSGKIGNLDVTLRYIVFNFALIAGGTFLFVFGMRVLSEGNTFRAMADFFVGVMCFLTIILLRTALPLKIPGGAAIGAFGTLCIMLVRTGDLHGIAGLWIFSFPLITIFILGLRMGLIYSTLMLFGVAAFTIIPGIANPNYTIDSATRLLGVYFLVGLLTVIYENTRLSKDKQVNQLNAELQVERDLITAMKDNLTLGIFLMDKDYIIQGAYSKPLEKILGSDNVEGKKFTDFLTTSLEAKEMGTLTDYFEMVVTRQFDAKMLEGLNPISDMLYVDGASGEEKIIKTVFSSVDMGSNNYFILGSIQDITATKELERQLAEEGGKREDEMKTLFQVIQVDPAVFGDFIDDTEYEFEHINEILKDGKLSAKDAMVDIYQSIHAIKANAVILSLDNFSNKLHELENVIKKYRDGDEVSFENVLHITIELEKIMKEKDKFRAVISRIESFLTKTGSKKRQDRYVLIETLTRACEKAAAAQEKNVGFAIEELDGSILEHGPRRIIKEVLTQLVRNSVYHGIESPEERAALGKNSQGTVRLSMTSENGLIHLKLSDDGKGLDMNKIRKKALGLKLLSKEAAENNNQLLQVIFSPGFSTAESENLTAGRGVGLSLVRERIKELRGSIKLSSEPGKGTTFNLFIPLEESVEVKAS